jgi:ferrous iron transport protein B
MGMQEDNWPAVVGVFSGILAKEVVVGTLDNLYASLASDGPVQDGDESGVWAQLVEAAATVPANLAAVGQKLLDPLGLEIGDVSDRSAAAAQQGVHEGVFGAMVTRFDGRAGAFAYLLFVLLYFPCVATIGAIRREAGRPWAAFVAGWTTLVAYITASSFYQVATYAAHPGTSIAWLLSLWVVFLAVVLYLRRWGRRQREPLSRHARAEA